MASIRIRSFDPGDVETFEHPFLYTHYDACPRCRLPTSGEATGRAACVDRRWQIELRCYECGQAWFDRSPAADGRAREALTNRHPKTLAFKDVRRHTGRSSLLLLIDGTSVVEIPRGVFWGDAGSYYVGPQLEGFEARLYDSDEVIVVSVSEESGRPGEQLCQLYRISEDEAVWVRGGRLEDVEGDRIPTLILRRRSDSR